MFRSIPALQLSRALATHASNNARLSTIRTRSKQEIQEIYDSPLLDLVFNAASVHRQHHDPGKIQLCTLMNIKSVFSAPLAPCS